MTRFGVGAALIGALMAVFGFALSWGAVAAVGVAITALLAACIAYVLRKPNLSLDRSVEPPRVEKGSPAISVIHATNNSRRPIAAVAVEQRLGRSVVRAVLPRLRGGESGIRTYRLPTTRRGVYEVGPMELRRADPFGLCRTVQRMGEPQRIEVHPRLSLMAPIPTGTSRNLEGPTSDLSPQGTTQFHRLREYVEGDDLRTIHWPSTARTGKLVVRHNVDTAQPYSTVMLDLRPSVHSEESFETSVDVAASLLVSLSVGLSPVQLLTTSGDRLGGPANRDAVPLVDFLTTVRSSEGDSLAQSLLALRRQRGGTALVVVTGRLDADSPPVVAALRPRFDRVIMISVTDQPSSQPAPPGVALLVSDSLESIKTSWNSRIGRIRVGQ